MKIKSTPFSRRQFLNSCSLATGAMLLPEIAWLANQGISANTNAKKIIPTLTGDIKPTNLGVTLMHEHLLFFNGAAPDDAGFQSIPDELKEESIKFVVQNLKDAARVGIQTIVDVGPFRPIDLYSKIAEQSPVKIIVSTGFYRESKLPPWLVDMKNENEMKDYMLKEITEGIGGTKLKAGIIKIAQQSNPLSPWEQKVFRSAAAVQKQTGTHIVTHTGNAVEQFDILTKNGADPKKIYFSHTDVNRKGKVGDLVRLLEAGSYLEVDTFAQPFYTPEKELMAFIRSVCDAGYSKQLFISIDSNWHWAKGEIKFEGSELPNLDPIASKRVFSFMVTDAIPTMLKNGFSLKEIQTFLIDNPRNYFAG